MTPTDIYEVCSGGMMLLLMILVYRYIYMEPGLVSRRNNGLFAGGFLLLRRGNATLLATACYLAAALLRG